MKTIFKTTIMLLLLGSSCVYGQRGIGTNTPDKSAILDLNSTTKGLLLPRLTMAEINDIDSPKPGLLVFCTNCATPGLSLFTDVWPPISGVSSSTNDALAIDDCKINDTFVQGESSIARNLTVTYKQTSIVSIGTLQFDASNVALTGAGSPELAVGTASPASYTFTGINDTVDVVYAISGNPPNTGDVTISVDYKSMAACGRVTTVGNGSATLNLKAPLKFMWSTTIDSGSNTRSYTIPYSGGIGTFNLTFSSLTSGGVNIQYPPHNHQYYKRKPHRNHKRCSRLYRANGWYFV
jgi:hypothetical protein